MKPKQSVMAVRRVREAAVAGYFYPKESEALRQEVSRLTHACLPHSASRLPLVHQGGQEGRQGSEPVLQSSSAIVPHAGYQFSGSVAGETFRHLSIPTQCIILGPNHTGWGVPWSLMAEGAYATPLGEVPIDEALATALLEACPLLARDALAHQGEHAIEVELPFLQLLGPEALSIVPIVIGSDDPQEFGQVGEALAQVIRSIEKPVLVLASSDFTHYEPRLVAAQKDAKLIEAIVALDEQEFLHRVQDLRVAMCGVGPVACLLGATKRLGATRAQLIRYATSADAGGDPASVVGYAGIILN